MNPILFHIGHFGVRYYSLLFIAGFILGWFIMEWMFKREKVPLKLLDPLLYTLLIATIVGARLGHCCFYQPEYYFGSWKGFWEIFMPWKGGLASHGGTIAIILALIWFAHHYGRPNHFDFFWLCDRLVIPTCFAAAFIRLGNLCNSEIYGDVTNLPWGFVFQLRGETLPKHPTQIYESLSYAILGFILLWIYRKRLHKVNRGFFLGTFMIVLFSMRFLIEFIKEPQVDFENSMTLNMGQLLSIPFIIFGIVVLIYSFKWSKSSIIEIPEPEKVKKPETHYAKSLSDTGRK